MDLDYAHEYFDWYGKLWTGQKDATRFVGFIWKDQELQGDYAQWVELWTKLNRLKDIDKRIPLIDLAQKIERKKPSAKFLRRLREFIANGPVGPEGSGLII